MSDAKQLFVTLVNNVGYLSAEGWFALVSTGETDPNDDQSYPGLLINLKKGCNQIALPVDVMAKSDLAVWLPVFWGAD
jgi:hypothetical protein